ncbi:hypothetical protein ACFL5H_02745, partial [Candidatus Latescibacterota bacterium]
MEKKKRLDEADQVEDYNKRLAKAKTYTEKWNTFCAKRVRGGFKQYPRFLDTDEPYRSWSPTAKLIFLEIQDLAKISDKGTTFKDEQGVFVKIKPETLSERLNIPISGVEKALHEIDRDKKLRWERNTSRIYQVISDLITVPQSTEGVKIIDKEPKVKRGTNAGMREVSVSVYKNGEYIDELREMHVSEIEKYDREKYAL